MKNLFFLVTPLLLLTIFSSCSKDELDIAPAGTEEEFALSEETSSLTVKSLSEIGLKRLTNGLPLVQNNFKEIATTDYNNLFQGYSLEDLSLNEDLVFINDLSDLTSYTLIGTIPPTNNEELPEQYVYLTLNFDAISNVSNEAAFGHQMDYFVSFDAEGVIMSNDMAIAKSGIVKPAKAPSEVICNYARQNPAFNVGPVQSYCGTWGTSTVPAPQHILDAIFNPNPLVHDPNDLYILVPTVSSVSVHVQFSIPWGQSTFSSYSNSAFPDLKDKIIDYYQSVYIPVLGRSVSTTSNLNAGQHVNKQAFIDSFFEWFYEMQYVAPNNYSFLVQNPQVLYDVFDIFAMRNADQPEDAGVYLGLSNGSSSSNPDIVCLTDASAYLLTLNGLISMSQLNAGSITLQQFENVLPGC